MSEKIAVSVIIPARNAADVIPDCIKALQQQTCDRSALEIIVIDDGSSDTTPDVVKSAGITLFSQENRGPAAARNAGVKTARGDIILFTDADCRPAADWVDQMMEPFKNDAVMGVKGVYRSDQTEMTARFVQAEYEAKYRFMAAFKTIDFIDTYSAGFRRNAFTALKGYDESFPGASVEDQEFSFRMHEAGYQMVFTPRAVVTHLHATSLRRYFRKKFNIGFWKMKVLREHPQKAFRDTHTPQGLKLQIPVAFILPVLVCLAPLTGWLPSVTFFCIFCGLGYREIRECLRKKAFDLAVISPFIMGIRAWGLGLGLLYGTLFPSRTTVNR
jgi:glycosyltransferase involved in cell wall biosynthesis